MLGKMEKISEEERKMRIDFIKNLIRDNETDHERLEKELQELSDIRDYKISEEEKDNRIFILTSLIRDNETDHTRLEKELQELLDLDPLK
jgi:hypothetical protein